MHYFCQFYAVWKKVRQRCWQIKGMPTYNADQGFRMNWDFWFPSETRRNNAIPTNLTSYEWEMFTGQCVCHLASCHTHCHNHHGGTKVVLHHMTKFILIWSNLSLFHITKFIHMTNLQRMLSFHDLHCFDAIPVLSGLTQFCVKEKLTQHSCLWSKDDKHDGMAPHFCCKLNSSIARCLLFLAVQNSSIGDLVTD